MLTDLMRDQQRRLVLQVQEAPHKTKPEIVTTLALIDILDILGDLRNPLGTDKPQAQ